MSKQNLKLGSITQVNIERCNGRLQLQSGSGSRFSYSSDGRVNAFEDADRLIISADDDLKVSAPRNVSLSVQHVADRLTAKDIGPLHVDNAEYDVKLSDLRNGVRLGRVMGDVEIKKGAEVIADQIEGDFSGKEIFGDVKIGVIGDDFSLRGGSGKIEVSSIGGDVFLNKISGIVKLDSVNGDVIFQGPLPAEKHHIIADGDVIIYWPTQRKVQFLVTHQGDLINDLRLPNEATGAGEFQATIGDDSCRLIIEAGGNVYLRPLVSDKERSKSRAKSKKKNDFDFDLEDLLDPEELIEKIGDGIKSMVMLQKRNKGRGMLGKIFNRALEEVDEWAGVPQEREARKQAARSNRQKEPSQTDRSNNPEEERRIILKLLENGSITVDEASERLKRL